MSITLRRRRSAVLDISVGCRALLAGMASLSIRMAEHGSACGRCESSYEEAWVYNESVVVPLLSARRDSICDRKNEQTPHPGPEEESVVLSMAGLVLMIPVSLESLSPRSRT
jgi:hypothetical protein